MSNATTKQQQIVDAMTEEAVLVMETLEHAVQEGIAAAVRLRAAHDAIAGNFDPLGAIVDAKQAMADYLRATADELEG